MVATERGELRDCQGYYFEHALVSECFHPSLDPCLWSPNLCENLNIFKHLRRKILFHFLWDFFLGKMFSKILKWAKSRSRSKMFGKHFAAGQFSKMFGAAGFQVAPHFSAHMLTHAPAPSITSTSHCVAHTQRSKLIEGSGQP